jgi:dTMP kinase
MERGTFIVIEGTDGSGKMTQATLLHKRLQDLQLNPLFTDFPDYSSPYGKLIKKILSGAYGDPVELDPYSVSLPYSLDRGLARDEMRTALDKGRWIVSNRFETANEIYQSIKFDDVVAQDEFIAWLRDLEYHRIGIPQPDLVLYLYVPIDVSRRLMEERAAKTGERLDQFEANIAFQAKVLEKALYLCDQPDTFWHKIECTKDGELMSIEQIQDVIWDVVAQQFHEALPVSS